MEATSRIYVAGHRGMVGSAIVRRLESAGCENIVTRTHSELDLTDQQAVRDFFRKERPEYVFLAAAKVGGIQFNNTHQAEMLYHNLAIQNNVIHNAFEQNVKKLLFLGSSCVYPRLSPQPMREEYLLTGPLEPTNEGYALAKIAGLKLCEYYQEQYGADFIAAMPCNIYGPKDTYDLAHSHFVPALIRRFSEALEAEQGSVTIWGTGTARRELLFVDDLADACHFLMENYDDKSFINVGSGTDHTISEYAHIIAGIIGYPGGIVFDTSKPDGMPRKVMDVSRVSSLGWGPRHDLETGIRLTVADYNKS